MSNKSDVNIYEELERLDKYGATREELDASANRPVPPTLIEALDYTQRAIKQEADPSLFAKNANKADDAVRKMISILKELPQDVLDFVPQNIVDALYHHAPYAFGISLPSLKVVPTPDPVEFKQLVSKAEALPDTLLKSMVAHNIMKSNKVGIVPNDGVVGGGSDTVK